MFVMRNVVESPPAASARRLPAREATLVGWRPPGGDMEHPEWVAVGHRLGRISRCNQWWVGDWLRYGSSKWGERYVEAARITGYDVRSLANMASIAASFDVSRRRENLTWSHHAAVAGLPHEEQDRWLDRASAERLSVADLRIELRSAERGSAKAAGGTLTPPVGEPPVLDEAAPVGQASVPVETAVSVETAGLTCPQCGYRLASSAPDEEASSK
jgi:hypothetical protein